MTLKKLDLESMVIRRKQGDNWGATSTTLNFNIPLTTGAGVADLGAWVTRLRAVMAPGIMDFSIGQGSGKRSDARRRTYACVCVCIAWANPGCAVLWDTNHMLWRTHSICGDEECRPRRGEKLTRRRDTKTTTRRQRCQAPALRACHPEGVRGY